MNKRFFMAAIAWATFPLASLTQADSLLGLYGGISSWEQSYDGTIQDLDITGGGDEIDFNNDLGLDEEKGNVIYIALEHGVPVFPNVKVQNTDIETVATGNPSKTINYGGETFQVSDTITTDADLSHTDVTMYYQVLDNWLSLDIGVTVRLFDGFINITSEIGDSASEDFNALVPLLYTKARFDLPLSGAYADIYANALGDGDNMFVDFQATIGYESSLGAGVEIGFRSLDLELDDIDDVAIDLTIDGAFVGVFYHL
ncbi:MAG: TIGR04219 family outer membrane beta-barrel protein [Pseudomonadales bacterium]|nr:TIGR04219 family outer membrane beta-barrel protein [Pseudomonadales bacterium]MDG2078746.1 TIGR04219 family outer membrane beta-barrel protein [Pseudomonadales bacterium]